HNGVEYILADQLLKAGYADDLFFANYIESSYITRFKNMTIHGVEPIERERRRWDFATLKMSRLEKIYLAQLSLLNFLSQNSRSENDNLYAAMNMLFDVVKNELAPAEM